MSTSLQSAFLPAPCTGRGNRPRGDPLGESLRCDPEDGADLRAGEEPRAVGGEGQSRACSRLLRAAVSCSRAVRFFSKRASSRA